MSNFNDAFNEIYQFKSSVQNRSYANLSKSESTLSMEDSLPSGPSSEFVLQRIIRPFYGKPGLNRSEIGTPPKFLGLENTDDITINHYACTLFVDIVGSTRLSLLYPPEEVYKFKNAVIKTCIEAIRSLDGHVHRIMGDAVMAFFFANGTSQENSIADTINCAITLKALLEKSVKPWIDSNLKEMDSSKFGFRIGCNFGDNKDIVWGSFGYSSVEEVSASGLQVDMASKLQSNAKRNQAMLGQDLLEFISFPDDYTQEGSTPFVMPNITRQDGSSLNYKMRHIDFDKFLRLSALPESLKADLLKPDSITQGFVIPNEHFEFYCNVNGERYQSASKFLSKEMDLEFTLHYKGSPAGEFSAQFTKVNHDGPDTPEKEIGIKVNKGVLDLTPFRSGRNGTVYPAKHKVSITESTRYRGLHTMKVEVKNKQRHVIYRNKIGVFIA